MDDLKLPIFLLICLVGGVGYYFYNKTQNPTKPHIKPHLKNEQTKSTPKDAFKSEEENSSEYDENLIKEAKSAIENANYLKAIELLSKVKEKDEKVNKMLAYSYYSSENLDKALPIYRKLTQKHRDSKTLYYLANILEKKCIFDEAYSIYLEIADSFFQDNQKRNIYESITRLAVVYPEKEDADKYFQELINENPTPDTILNYIKYKSQKNDFEGTDSLASTIEENYNDSFVLNYELAKLYDKSKKYEEAVKYYKKCINIDNKNFIPFLDCYKALIKLDKPESAINALERFLNSGIIFPDIYFEASLIANKFKRYRQAFRFYLIAVTSDTKLQGKNDENVLSNAENYFKQQGTETEKILVNAFICYLNGDYKFSISEIKRIKSDLENSIYKNDYLMVLDACEVSASLDKEREDEVKAYEDYVQAQKNEERLKKEAELKKKQESNGGALVSERELLERAKNNKDNFDVLVEVGKALAARGNNKQAKEQFVNAINLNKNSFIPYLELARIHMNEHDSEGSKKNIEMCLKLSPTDPEVLSMAANICLSNNDIANAKKYAESALENSSNDTDAMIAMAKVYMNLQNYDKANSYIEEALDFEKRNNKRSELFKLQRNIRQLRGN